ncbi:thermonuclease family protein [Arthrobacter sp. NPDC058130]|uniref:thermonuclease family protein n=1 Tax=Arthrobacter sp. NPDC058130 TaxID=3346353 RepID=UPI0036EEBF3C
MVSTLPGALARTKAVGIALAALMALSGCNSSPAAESNAARSEATGSGADQATVIRVIDGDTFEASINGEQKTVRLLNVDTPETKDPNAPVECMGPEATKGLEQLLPVGAKIRLELDVEPLDKYGRTLAGVFDSAGKLVNAEIARLGLGVPVLFEPNKKFYPPVVEAFDEARARGVGLNSSVVACLPSQEVAIAAQAVETLVAAPLSDSAADLDRGHAGLVAALATVAALKAEAKDGIHWAAYKTTQVSAMLNRLDSAATTGAAKQAAIGAKKKELADAEAAAAAARQAAETAAAGAAAAEAERIRNLPPAPAPYVPPAPAPYVPPAYVPPAYVPPAPAPNPYPGYNGPRCYAPGGKTWTPCSKR